MTAPLYHSLIEAAALLGVGRSTLYRLIAEGQLRLTKIGRRSLVARAELERFAARLAEAPLPRV